MNNASSEIEFFRRRVAELERQVVAGPHMPPGDADTLLLSQLGTFEWDLRTGEIALDEHSRAMFDLRSPARIGIGDLLERVHSEDRARLHSEVQEALDRASRIETQFRIVLPSGEVRRIGTVGRAVGAERFVGVFADRHQAPVERDMRLATFDAVLARLQEFVYLFDPDGRLRYVNQPLLDLWGITAEEAIGKDFHDLGYPPELVELHRGQIQRVIETRQPVEGSNAYTSRQGVTGYYEYTFVPLFGPDGAVEAVGGRTRDITLERNAREALESSEEKYRSLFDSIDQGSCIIQLIFDPQGRPVDYLFLETNPVFEKQTGLRHAVGRTARELVPGLEPFWFETYGSVALTGKPVRFVRHAEAMERWFDVYAFRIGKPEDRRVALLFSDITDRKRAESEKESLLAQIQAERQRLERILSQAPVAIVVVRGPEYIVDLANPSYRALLQGRDIIGRRFADVVPEPVTEVWQAFERVRSTGEPFVVNDSYVRYDGDGDGLMEDHWFNIAYHPLRDDDGAVSGVVAVCSEVTAQVLARKDLERANRELEEFAYVASHDLQEPLRMINIYTELLLRRHVADHAEARQYARFVQTGVARMEALIQDLLAFSRTIHAEEGSTAVADLSVSFDEAVAVLRERIVETGAVISASPLPTVRGDTKQIAGVFQNLLSNALKYRSEGVAPHVRVTSACDSSRCTVSVYDNGIGFEQQYAERIFGLFKRLHKDAYPGTGLGLAICRRIIERYGGRIWAESEPGRGSAFHFTLPLAKNE